MTRGAAPGLLRRPGGQGLIVILRVVPNLELRWHDVEQGLEAGIRLARISANRTEATVSISAPWWKLTLEGARGLPRQALQRLHDLCQTAARL